MASIDDHIFALLKEIWGKKKLNRGFNWVAAKFGLHHGSAPDTTKQQIVSCLTAKRDHLECPIHTRIHTAKP